MQKNPSLRSLDYLFRSLNVGQTYYLISSYFISNQLFFKKKCPNVKSSLILYQVYADQGQAMTSENRLNPWAQNFFLHLNMQLKIFYTIY